MPLFNYIDLPKSLCKSFSVNFPSSKVPFSMFSKIKTIGRPISLSGKRTVYVLSSLRILTEVKIGVVIFTQLGQFFEVTTYDYYNEADLLIKLFAFL